MTDNLPEHAYDRPPEAGPPWPTSPDARRYGYDYPEPDEDETEEEPMPTSIPRLGAQRAQVISTPKGCTGWLSVDTQRDDVLVITIQHDGPTCPIHEAHNENDH